MGIKWTLRFGHRLFVDSMDIHCEINQITSRSPGTLRYQVTGSRTRSLRGNWVVWLSNHFSVSADIIHVNRSSNASPATRSIKPTRSSRSVVNFKIIKFRRAEVGRRWNEVICHEIYLHSISGMSGLVLDKGYVESLSHPIPSILMVCWANNANGK